MHDVVKVCGAKHCCVVTSVSQPPTFPCSAWASQASEVCLVSGRREFPLLTVCVRRQRHLQLQQPLKLSGTNIRKTAWTDGKGVFENTTSQLPHQIYVCNVKLIFLFSRIQSCSQVQRQLDKAHNLAMICSHNSKYLNSESVFMCHYETLCLDFALLSATLIADIQNVVSYCRP